MLYFYQPKIKNGQLSLEEEEFQHCIKVLRKNIGDQIGILDGKGGKYEVEITSVGKRSCDFKILNEEQLPAKPFHQHLAMAPTKNTDRIEWFVEKACELGIDEISFILTSNCERNKMRIDRLTKKAVSALKQSKSGFLTKINELEKLDKFISKASADHKFIAFVQDGLPYFSALLKPNTKTITLIGPEGDFTHEEVELTLAQGFQKISLGKSTLRTETAGLMATHFVNVVNGW